MPPRVKTAALAAFAALAIWTAPAWGAPTISGADGDVWNAASPAVTYTITGSAPGVEVGWALTGGHGPGRPPAETGPSPLTVTLPDIRDGDYRLVAAESIRERGRPEAGVRSFSVDRTPPTVEVKQPQNGAVYAMGQKVKADYRCRGERSCAGPVPDGDLLPTAVLGPQAFAVTAVDAAGNVTTLQYGYTVVVAGTTPLTPTPPIAPAPAPGAAPPAQPAPVAAVLPPPENASRLRPRLGARLHSLRPVLRWKPLRGALLYNVQVFRLRGTRLIKVLSVFPRRNSVRVPPRRLKAGAKHVWRVWPMVGTRYTAKPLGISNFEVRRSARPS